MRIVFRTRFNPAPNRNVNKVYDRHDLVDRVSYVDSSLLIQRFIREGESLQRARARALGSGFYSHADVFSEKVDGDLCMPVYPLDPAEVEPIVESAKARSARLRSEKSERILNVNQSEDVSPSVEPTKANSNISTE